MPDPVVLCLSPQIFIEDTRVCPISNNVFWVTDFPLISLSVPIAFLLLPLPCFLCQKSERGKMESSLTLTNLLYSQVNVLTVSFYNVGHWVVECRYYLLSRILNSLVTNFKQILSPDLYISLLCCLLS